MACLSIHDVHQSDVLLPVIPSTLKLWIGVTPKKDGGGSWNPPPPLLNLCTSTKSSTADSLQDTGLDCSLHTRLHQHQPGSEGAEDQVVLLGCTHI